MSIRQIGQDQRFAQFFRHATTLAGLPGITVTVDVYRMGGGGTPIVADASAIDLGGGAYGYTLAGASAGAADLYFAVFKTSDANALEPQLIAGADVGLIWTERIDDAITTRATAAGAASAVWAAGTRTLTGFGTLVADIWTYATRTLSATGLDAIAATATGAVNIARAVWDRALSGHSTAGSAGAALSRAEPESIAAAVVSRLQQDVVVVPDGPVQGDLVLVQGDDYLDADDRALKFDFYNAPDLTGATVDLGFALPDGNVVAASGSMSELTDEDGNTFWRATIDLPSSATVDLAPLRRGGYPYQATVLRGGHRLTYRAGIMRLIASATIEPDA